MHWYVKPLILAVFMKISEVHTLFNGVVMSFVMNIGDNLHLLSLRCCCLYFKRNLPQLLCFFFGQKLLYLPIINFVICHILRILQLCLFMHTIAPVPSVVRSLQFRKSQSKFAVSTQRVLLDIKATLCVLHSSFMQLLSIYKNQVIMNNVMLIRYLTRPSPY